MTCFFPIETPPRRLAAILAFAAILAGSACTRDASPPVRDATKPDAPAAHAADEADEASSPPETTAGHEGADADGHDAAPAEVRMNDAELRAAGVALRVLAPSTVAGRLRAAGEVLDDAYGTTLITPRIAGLVVRREARLGDEVAAGAALVTLASVEVSDAQADLRIAEQEWRRVASLGTEAVSGRRIGEARIAVERARAKARAYGLPGSAHGDADGQFTLRAPHAGRITEDAFVVGERIEPGRALYRLVDERKVWVDAKLPPGTAPRFADGAEATVIAGQRRLAGRVLRTAHRTSETTRNASVRIEVPNQDDLLHAGDFVDVYLPTTGAPGLSLPTTALVQLGGDTVAFRRTGDGALAPVAVRTGATIGDDTVILEGLAAGDAVAVAGVFALKARMLKAQLGEGHGH